MNGMAVVYNTPFFLLFMVAPFHFVPLHGCSWLTKKWRFGTLDTPFFKTMWSYWSRSKMKIYWILQNHNNRYSWMHFPEPNPKKPFYGSLMLGSMNVAWKILKRLWPSLKWRNSSGKDNCENSASQPPRLLCNSIINSKFILDRCMKYLHNGNFTMLSPGHIRSRFLVAMSIGEVDDLSKPI
jgi:hypothetical protein